MKIFYYQWLIKRLLWPTAGQNRVRHENYLNAGRKKVESGSYVAAEGERHQDLTSRPQPHGDTLIEIG